MGLLDRILPKRADKKRALDELFHEVGTYKKSKDFQALLDFVRRFPSFAPFNAMLLHIQKPGAAYVASARQWREGFNRTIKPGARPLLILVPFGPVGFVYALDDTIGDTSLPKELIEPFKATGKLPPVKMTRLIDNLVNDGIAYYEADYGSDQAGAIQVTDASSFRLRTTGGRKIKIAYNLIVNSNMDKETKFTTIVHELAHLYCGHLPSPIISLGPDRDILPSENEREFEAESVTWLICERIGIHNPSAKYLAHYLEDNDEIPGISVETVLTAANKIESRMERSQRPQRALLGKK